MQVYSFYSPSHEPMFNRFLAPSAIRAGFTVTPITIPQLCLTGSYYDSGWIDTMQRKVELLRSISRDHRNEPALYSDCDVIFNPANINPERVREDLGSHFIAMQDDIVQYCCGFMIMKGTPELDVLLDRTMGKLQECGDDQTAMNHVVQKHHVRAKRLPKMQYACIAQFSRMLGRDRVWNGAPFKLPRRLKIFHANWTRGVAQKEQLLQFVQQQLAKQ